VAQERVAQTAKSRLADHPENENEN
jgi:hypothetical protein